MIKTLSKLVVLVAVLVGLISVWNRFVGQSLDATDAATQAGRPAEFTPLNQPVPDFTLTERSGQPLSLADLRGKVWIANLMFTSCPDVCLVLSGEMGKLDRELADQPAIRLVSISITPEYDTPERLREYAERFQASGHWLFLTGEREVIVNVANKGFLLSAGTEGTVTHSEKFVLVDSEGKARGLFDSANPASRKALLEQAKALAFAARSGAQ